MCSFNINRLEPCEMFPSITVVVMYPAVISFVCTCAHARVRECARVCVCALLLMEMKSIRCLYSSLLFVRGFHCPIFLPLTFWCPPPPPPPSPPSPQKDDQFFQSSPPPGVPGGSVFYEVSALFLSGLSPKMAPSLCCCCYFQKRSVSITG